MVKAIWRLVSLFLSLGVWLAVGIKGFFDGEELIWLVLKSVGAFMASWFVLKFFGDFLCLFVNGAEGDLVKDSKSDRRS